MDSLLLWCSGWAIRAGRGRFAGCAGVRLDSADGVCCVALTFPDQAVFAARV